MCQEKSSVILQNFETKINAYKTEIAKLVEAKEKMQDSLKQCEEELEAYRKSQNYKLSLIEESKLELKDLMWKQEFMIYKELIFCKEITNNFLIFSQVSTKAFIKSCDDTSLFSTYGNLYVDFLFAPKDLSTSALPPKPFAILEFHGSGHYKDNEEKVRNNDEIKERVLTK